ncbi:alpha/beta fold hydrolase [Flavobacterium sp. HBTb2-11-1]|uniref:alpha/beta fold hydrolase n=1 Tax=Flavobacterium sp. HBTb2-11-1 TaxID=2692212 RepID=UPI00136F8106|nr:alpha/beta hydrolase [Flavobacterium sp. HBTb2-11-1]MXO07305.1 alpha/beta fold hydrolase [Flavobacterium sp. HBTb2-11-1]
MNLKTPLLFILFLCFSQSVIGQIKTEITQNPNITFTTSDGVPLFLKVSGKGEVCIFVHGGPGAWSKSFEEFGGNVLEDKLTMCYYDQRGCGRSGSPADNNYSMDRMINDIEEIRTHLKTDKIFVIGHSFGGILATKYAEKYPQHVKGLILLNATLDINDSLLNQIAFMSKTLGKDFPVKGKDSILNTFFEAKQQIKKADLDYKMLSDNRATVEKLDSIDNSEKRNSSFAQHALSDPSYFSDFTKETATIKVPTLVISGTKDNNIGPDHYRLFKFPNQEVKIIDGGHILYYEQNKEFKNTVQKFVQKVR